VTEQGRSRQKGRTRDAIVRAATSLLERGERPSIEDVAAEARVSRATAYRYFAGLDALLIEAADALENYPDAAFGGDVPPDAAARLTIIDDMIDSACREREATVRLMLARLLERSALRDRGDEPVRENRRLAAIDEALEPLRDRLGAAQWKRLSDALAMIVGVEGFIALTDIAGLGEAEAREVRRWTIAALLAVALAESEDANAS
jgi:AcrR family transcriptional regulator